MDSETATTILDAHSILTALRARRQSQAAPIIEASLARRQPLLDRLRENVTGVEAVWAKHGEWVTARAQALSDAVWTSYPTLGHEHGAAVRALDEAMVIQQLITQARAALEKYTRATAPVGQAGLESHLEIEEAVLRREVKNLWAEDAQRRITQAQMLWERLAKKAGQVAPELLTPTPEPAPGAPEVAPRKSALGKFARRDDA